MGNKLSGQPEGNGEMTSVSPMEHDTAFEKENVFTDMERHAGRTRVKRCEILLGTYNVSYM